MAYARDARPHGRGAEHRASEPDAAVARAHAAAQAALHDGDIEVDPVNRTARIKAGARWGDVVDAVAPHGLAVMHGSSPSVGVIGYLLGGGLSFYGRRHGLAVNHVRAFEVVTPDGLLRRVDAEHNRELFYALRGGGGGYAIVTAVEIGLLPYAEVTGGALFFAAEDARRVLRAWLGWTAHALGRRSRRRSASSTCRRCPRCPSRCGA